MYFLYDELQRAIGGKLCCSAHFCNEVDENIVVCSSDTMIVYQVVSYRVQDTNEHGNKRVAYQLRLVSEYPLSGEVLSSVCVPMNVVFPVTDVPHRDALIMSFKGNYVSVVSFDDYDTTIQTIECYDFNREACIAQDSSGDSWI